MPDLSTSWMGLSLRSPLVIGASPLSDDLKVLQQLVAAGAGAVVLPSLFEEQITAEQMGAFQHIDAYVDMDAEARSFLPPTEVFSLGVEPYVERIARTRMSVDVPLVASLNGVTPGGWTELAAQLAQAGVDAIELNLYEVATSLEESGAELEARQLEVVASVLSRVSIPIAVKLSPFYTSVPHFVTRLQALGVAGVTLFNRFYQPDVDLEELDMDRHLVLSTPAELPLRLHALALLHGRVTVSLACSGGVHGGQDAARAILCGASAVQMVAAPLLGGPDLLTRGLAELEQWLNQKGYRSVSEACGVMALDKVADPHALERLNYTRLLQGWRGLSRRR